MIEFLSSPEALAKEQEQEEKAPESPVSIPVEVSPTRK